jgi:hypothetical protein
MKSVDVDIYMNQLVKFFNDNPKDLNALIGSLDSDQFYEEIKKQAIKNCENGQDITLSQSQIINIVVKMNEIKDGIKNQSVFFYSKFGKICLN